jgi:hypothetical protein
VVVDRFLRGDEERIGVIAQALPERGRIGCRDRLAADRRRAFGDRRFGAAQAHDQVAVPPRARVERQRSLSPRVQHRERIAGLAVEAQRRLGRGTRHHLERDLDDDAEDAERAGDDARDVVAGDVLDDAAAELQQLAGAVHHRDAEDMVAHRACCRARRPRESRSDHAADGRLRREARRLEREALAVHGELRFELDEPHPGRRGDDELGRLVVGAAGERGRVEERAARLFAVEVLAAATADAKRLACRVRRAHLLDDRRDRVHRRRARSAAARETRAGRA